MTPLLILSFPIWSYSLIKLIFRPRTNVVNYGLVTLLSIPQICVVGAMGAMMFDSPQSEGNPMVMASYLTFTFGPSLITFLLATFLPRR